MNPLEPSDLHHLSAAQGWMEVGNPLQALEELEKLTGEVCSDPRVLILRWNVLAALRRWEEAIEIMSTFTRIVPQLNQGWLDLGNSFFWAGRIKEAYACMKGVLPQFPQNPAFPYNLACYTCQMGQLREARQWLEKTLQMDATNTLRQKALEDTDLKPMWGEIENIGP